MGGNQQAMNMTPKEYDKFVKSKAEKSPLLKNCVNAFLFGGAICCIGQLFLNLYNRLEISQIAAATLTSMTLVFLGALLTGLGLYDNIAKYAGAGTIVPITGFANSIVSPAMEFKCEGFVMGIGAKMFAVAGPVLVYGITASVLYGIVYYFVTLWGGK